MWRLSLKTKPGSFLIDDESHRRKLILKVLIGGAIILTVIAAIIAILRIFMGSSHNLNTIIVLSVCTFIFIGFYALVNAGYQRIVSIVFIVFLFIIVTQAIARWGVLIPQPILMYSFIIVMSGVLLSARTALLMSAFITLTLITVKFLEENGKLHFDEQWLSQSGGYTDIIVYGLTFGVIALVSWLSNREIERSLIQARRSEKALTEERNSLEAKVEERTKQLEKAQVEKMLEMHRFAEFGRMGSTLLHDIANPLTAISLTLSQSGADQGRQKLFDQIRRDIKTMERYIDGARRQLRNQSEIKLFSVNREIQRIQGLFATKIKALQVGVEMDIEKDLQIRGDSIHFDHVVSNLLSNALDAYHETSKPRRNIRITAKRKDLSVWIEVKDFGKGIAKEDIPRIFEPFYSTKHSERSNLGIGLAIVKDTIEESFGGTISVSSVPGKSTSFTVKLPLT